MHGSYSFRCNLGGPSWRTQDARAAESVRHQHPPLHVSRNCRFPLSYRFRRRPSARIETIDFPVALVAIRSAPLRPDISMQKEAEKAHWKSCVHVSLLPQSCVVYGRRRSPEGKQLSSGRMPPSDAGKSHPANSPPDARTSPEELSLRDQPCVPGWRQTKLRRWVPFGR